MTDPYEGQLQPRSGGCLFTRDRRHEWRLLEGDRLYDNGRYVGYRFYCVHCLEFKTKEDIR